MGGSGEKERKAKRTFTGQSWSPPEFISLAFLTDLLGPVPAADDNGSTRASVFSPSPRASCDSSLSRREDLKGCFQSMLGRREQSLRKTAALRLSFQNFPTFRRGWEDTGFSWGDFTCPSGGRPAPFPLGKSKWTAKALLLTPRVTGPCASPCHRRAIAVGQARALLFAHVSGKARSRRWPASLPSVAGWVQAARPSSATRHKLSKWHGTGGAVGAR